MVRAVSCGVADPYSDLLPLRQRGDLDWGVSPKAQVSTLTAVLSMREHLPLYPQLLTKRALAPYCKSGSASEIPKAREAPP